MNYDPDDIFNSRNKQIPISDLNRIKLSKFKKYLIQDGPHPLEASIEDMESDGYKTPEYMQGSIQKVYRFPNGYGVSIVRGYFSFFMWEVIILDFKPDGDYRLISDIDRFQTWNGVEDFLKGIYNLKRKTFLKDRGHKKGAAGREMKFFVNNTDRNSDGQGK